MTNPTISIEIANKASDIGQHQWDTCACPEAINGERPLDPFTTFSFISALEESGSVGKGTGWSPCHLVAKRKNQIVGIMPLYLKSHSQGEYIFDQNWAHAYERSGGRYYPKLQSAVPFTPVTGRRFLAKKDFEREIHSAFISGLKHLAIKNDFSSAHITFCTLEETQRFSKDGFYLRKGMQFHWENNGYTNFDDFLSSLSSRKRKAIRKERLTAKSFWNNKGKIVRLNGKEINPKHWDSFWTFYQDTGNRKWGYPYLTRSFFNIIQRDMSENILLILAMEDETPIAGALNFLGQNTIYGRYWGTSKFYSCLHYELCYYQAIDYALEKGLKKIEAGAQGEHKLGRGYLPNYVYSLHWFQNQIFSQAIKDYLCKETDFLSNDFSVLSESSPFKKE